MNDRVAISIEDGVAEVRLTRPDKMNALDEAMQQALAEAGERLKADKSVRAIVLSGEGKSFCAGLDMGRFADMAGKPKDEARSAAILARTHGPANFVQAMTWVWREMPVPVIAAVQGHALGGGIQIALACDMRFVTPDAKLSVMEMKWGLIPDLGATQLLWRLTRDDIARDLIYTGRTISGEEAFALGLATRVCADPRQEALSAARAIAMQNPDAIRAAKRLLNNAPPLGPEKGLLAESQEIQNLIGSPNQIEAVVANMEKRAPRFTDPAS